MFALNILLVLFLVLGVAFVSCQHEERMREGREERASPSEHDYEIYELIDRLNKLKPEHSTFYDLLGVKDNATSEVISRQFRRLGFSYHPDKNSGNQEATKMFTLYSGAAQILKSAETRRRYEWILHEAPPWHRSQVYLIHQMNKRKRRSKRDDQKEISVLGLGAFLIGSLTLAQFLVQWTRFLINRYWIWSGIRALKAIPAQELRRMEKKALRSDLTFLSNVDANFENLQASRAEKLPIPKPTDLFILKVPLALLKIILSPLLGKNKRE